MKSLYINKLDVKLLDYHWTKITVFGLKYPLFGLFIENLVRQIGYF